MSRRFAICAPKLFTSRGETKTKWVELGVAFETAKGIKLHFDALPLNFAGELMLFPDEVVRADRDGNAQRSEVSGNNDGDVPF